MEISRIESEYYLRFQVIDGLGVLARMTRIMGDNKISVQSMIQPALSDHPDDPVQVILTTHRAVESNVIKSLEEIAALESRPEDPLISAVSRQLIAMSSGEESEVSRIALLELHSAIG